jgi:hypothetical protein
MLSRLSLSLSDLDRRTRLRYQYIVVSVMQTLVDFKLEQRGATDFNLLTGTVVLVGNSSDTNWTLISESEHNRDEL